ncbi:LysR family transcriptional regulator [Crossiella cryophila]|uniref:LysR family transcriptional regulator n=1 Tax=Crossiella cryophila TaxID=43355 RepID=UPI0031EAE5C9
MDRLETRELEYFLAVAEELHFGRAADRLGMAQPPLSRAISRLERRLGVRLFERTSRRVELTAAGQVLRTEGRRALAALDTAASRTQRAGAPPRLVLAARPGAGAALLADLVSAYGPAGVEIVFVLDRAAALRAGEADLAVLCASTDDLSGLRTLELLEETPVALLPPGHALAGRVAVTQADLRALDGYTPECPPLALDEIVDRVAFGRLIVVAGASTADRVGQAVVTVPVADLPATRLVLAWPESAPQPAVAAFLRTARTVLAQRKPASAS